DQMARGHFETHALAGLEHLARGNALGLETEGLQVTVELVERGLVGDLEREEIDARLVGLADQHAAVLALVPGLEGDPALRVMPGLDQAERVLVEVYALFEVKNAKRDVSRTQYASHCHVDAPPAKPGRYLPVRAGWKKERVKRSNP